MWLQSELLLLPLLSSSLCCDPVHTRHVLTGCKCTQSAVSCVSRWMLWLQSKCRRLIGCSSRSNFSQQGSKTFHSLFIRVLLTAGIFAHFQTNFASTASPSLLHLFCCLLPETTAPFVPETGGFYLTEPSDSRGTHPSSLFLPSIHYPPFLTRISFNQSRGPEAGPLSAAQR